MTAEKASWSSAGINVGLNAQATNTVLGEALPCPKDCSWELADADIKATELTHTTLTRYEDYLAKQLPVVWEPNPATSLTGVTPQDPIGSITSAKWRWKS